MALAELHRDRPAWRGAASAFERAARPWPRELQLQHAVASHFGVSVRLGHRPPDLATVAAVTDFAATAMPACDRRLTGDWAKENERRAAWQRAEQHCMADYYARTIREQEERENAEARVNVSLRASARGKRKITDSGGPHLSCYHLSNQMRH